MSNSIHQEALNQIRQHRLALELAQKTANFADTCSPYAIGNLTFEEWANTLKIKTATGISPWQLFSWQKDFSEVLLTNPKTPITLLSSRQTGKTIGLLGLAVFLCLTRPQMNVLFVHRKLDDARHLARRFKRLIPTEVKLLADSLSLIEFPNNSIAHFRGSGMHREDGAEIAGRGLESVDLCVIEEASHCTNVRELLGVIGPTMTHSPMASMVLVGTSGRKETYFYESLVSAYGSEQELTIHLEGIRERSMPPFQVKPSPDRIAVITNWRAIQAFSDEGIGEDGTPNYLKRIQKEQDLTTTQIASEHELKFNSDSMMGIFDFKQVLACQGGSWQPVEPDTAYYAAIDGSGLPRKGKGDYTVCIVLKKTGDKLKVVKLYRKRGISFERRYGEICELLASYRPLQVFVEANDGLGQSYHESILSGCPDLRIERWVQTRTRKEALINKIQLALEREDIMIPKSHITTELQTFVRYDDGTAGAIGKDAHDDCVMALGMALAAGNYGY